MRGNDYSHALTTHLSMHAAEGWKQPALINLAHQLHARTVSGAMPAGPCPWAERRLLDACSFTGPSSNVLRVKRSTRCVTNRGSILWWPLLYLQPTYARYFWSNANFCVRGSNVNLLFGLREFQVYWLSKINLLFIKGLTGESSLMAENDGRARSKTCQGLSDTLNDLDNCKYSKLRARIGKK